jgi:hypothetical protein
MSVDTDQGLLEVENNTSKPTNDFDIDIIIKDLIAIGTDKVLSDINIKEIFVEKISKFIGSEHDKLKESLIKIIQDRLQCEVGALTTQYNAQIKQKQTDTQNQLNADLTAKVQAVQQDLEKMIQSRAFTSQKHFDDTVAAKKAEIESYKASRVQQFTSQFSKDIALIESKKETAGKAIVTTAQNIFEQKSKDLSSIITAKSKSLAEEL